jgi:hypothetical protein
VGRVAIPNTYIMADDPGRSPGGKNNDYQDIVWLVSNVAPATAQGPVIGAATNADLTKGGTVGSSCTTTGFDGVLAGTGTACVPGDLSFGAGGLTVKSTSGSLAAGTQQDALYKNFDATRGQFTVDAKVVGPVTSVTAGSQAVGSWFGPDQNNWVSAQVVNSGGTEKVAMVYREKGTTTTVASVAVPGLTSSSTVDLEIVGNTSVPDPASGGANGFPLDEVTVWYSINGAAAVQVGTVKYPADVSTWFSRMAKAGILATNAGTTATVSPTFSKFAITAP